METIVPAFARDSSPPVKMAVVSSALVLFVACLIRFVTPIRTIFVFAYNCFIQPIGKVANQGERLDRFYQNQAQGMNPSILM